MESTGSYKSDDLGGITLDTTELRLGLPGTSSSCESVVTPAATRRGAKRTTSLEDQSSSTSGCAQEIDQEAPARSPKMLVVGWPPVRTFRRNVLQAVGKPEEKKAAAAAAAQLVKVSMDGAPYLRKIDLNAYKGYRELKEALDAMFKCCSVGSLHYTITYEDRDGDWMLAGDVPWGMFSSSCKRLRLARGSESNWVELSL